MKRLFNISIYTFCVAVLFTSCAKNFQDINTNPNTLPNVRPEVLMEPAIYDVVSRNLTRNLRLNNELMQVHVTVINSDQIHRYIIRPTESNYMWENWYLQLTNFKDMYDQAEFLGEPALQGVARIMEAYVFSLLTDTYGDVPYSQANLGRDSGIFQPKFDTQKDIYRDLFVKLEEANTLLSTAAAPSDDIAKLEPLYGSQLSAAGQTAQFNNYWRRFGNTLYLRLLLRVAHKSELNTAAEIRRIVETEAANYPMFQNNAASAVLRFKTAQPYQSPFANYRDYDFNGENGLTQFFINTLNNWADPRRAVWANPVGVSNYEGIPSGYLPGAQPERLSTYRVALKNEPLLGNIINYPELQFMLAECALKGYITGNEKTYYDNGVTNAITFWNLAVPDTLLANPFVSLDSVSTFEEKLERIITQKYFTYFFTDFQQWFEYRRTGYPDLPIGPGVENNGEMPARFKYPVTVQTLNVQNYAAAVASMGGDDLNVKVWWQKPD